MKSMWMRMTVASGMLLLSGFAAASDLTIHLNGTDTVKRNTVKYQCDAQGEKMGLPAGDP